MKSPRRRKYRQDVDVFRDPAFSGLLDAEAILFAATEQHVKDAHGGDPYDASTFDCALCKDLDENERELERQYESEVGDEGSD